MFTEYISSVQNPKIKALLCLQEKSKYRKEEGLFVVEGLRELSHCIAGNYSCKCLFICEKISSSANTNVILEKVKKTDEHCQFFTVSSYVYEKIAYRSSSEGIIGVFHYNALNFEELLLPKNPLIVVLDAIEKPGNIGAVLRSCDAAKSDLIILSDCLTDLFNPNLIRASLGGVFTQKIICTDRISAIKFLKNNNIQILTAQLQNASLYYDTDMTKATAIVMGAEDKGLTEEWRQAADKHIKIPMLGQLDSLNVSVSAGILIFEALRQRKQA